MSPERDVDPARVVELSDRADIAALVHMYAQSADRGDVGKLASLFTDDGVLVVGPEPGPDAVRKVASVLTGRDEIERSLEKVSGYRMTSHEITSHTSDPDGDTARARTACVAHHFSGSGPDARDKALYIVYVDDLSRIAGGWRFSRRELRIRAAIEQPVQIEITRH